MNELVAWAATTLADRSLHPLIVIAVFVVVFLAIHPFQDGNGRLSRVLTTLLLLKAGYEYVPYTSLESVIEKTKEGYYLALRRTQGTLDAAEPDWQPWINYFLSALREQKRILQIKVERERLVLTSLPELSAQILDLARAHGRITITDVGKATGVSHATLKGHLRALVEKRYLARHGKGRGTWYSLA